MPKETTPTFEQVNAHVERHLTSADAQALAAAPNVCGAYRVVRPILKLILAFPLIPTAWKTVIRTFMSALDVMCPIH